MRPPPALALHFMHQDQVASLPPGAVALGRADHCPVALIQAAPAMVGVQPHPEFTAAYTGALLAERVARIGDEAVAAAGRPVAAHRRGDGGPLAEPGPTSR